MPQKNPYDPNKRHLLYDLFNPRGNGRGLSKEEMAKPRTFSRFFGFYFNNFNSMFALNIFFFLGNFPLLFGLYALTGNLNYNVMAPVSSLFPTVYGAVTLGGWNPVNAAVMGLHGLQQSVSFPTTATRVFALLTLLVVFTFGIVNVATSYVMRNLVKGDPTLLVSDLKYAIKRNWRQGLILGIIDLLFLFIIAYDLFFFRVASVNGFYAFLFGVMVIVAMLYLMMRPYLYLMAVTFDLSIWKILKNAFIFSMLGFKRNLAAFLGGLAVWVIDYLILSVVFPVGLILPVMFLVSFTMFMGVYASYPKIKEIMIDPYYVSDDVGAKLKSEAGAPEPEEEPIFRDRG